MFGTVPAESKATKKFKVVNLGTATAAFSFEFDKCVLCSTVQSIVVDPVPDPPPAPFRPLTRSIFVRHFKLVLAP
jgi:hypothetical protein